jgi:hypothetical protein
MRPKDPGDRRGVASRLEGHQVIGAEARGERLELDRRRADPASRSDLPVLRDRHLAEPTMNI